MAAGEGGGKSGGGATSKFDWLDASKIIQVVTTPLGFFALVVLIVEVVLGTNLKTTSGTNQVIVIVGMLLLIFSLVGIVTYMACFRLEELLGVMSGDRPRVDVSSASAFDESPKAFRRFWAPLIRDDCLLVLGRFLKQVEALETSGLVGFGDSMACAELRAKLESQGAGGLAVAWADLIQGDSLWKNLILLGGPDPNSISREFLARIQPSLRCGVDDPSEVEVRDAVEGTKYVPRRVEGPNRVGTDYGIIIRAENPFAAGKKVLYVAGSFGFGTWAGVRYLLTEEFLNNKLVSSGRPFECLIETEVVRDAPLGIRLVKLRELKKTSSR